MSYQFSNVKTSGRTKYFPLQVSRIYKSQTGVIENSEEFSRFIFLTNYNESFEAAWSTHDANFGALNKTHRYSQTNRKIELSFKLPARNVADSKENLEFCQNLARIVYGKYYTNYETSPFGFAIYNYQGALFDIRLNFGNLIRNENVYVSDFSFTPNFDAGIFEVSISVTILHDYPLGFGGPRRPGEPYKWAENENRDWPHGTGPTYPVLQYMTKDNNAASESLFEIEEPSEGEVPSETFESKGGPLDGRQSEYRKEFYINEYGEIVFIE